MKIKKISLLKEKQLNPGSTINSLRGNLLCACSDLAVLMGIEHDAKTRNGSYWVNNNATTDKKRKTHVWTINNNGSLDSSIYNNRNIGVRLVIPFSDIEDFDKDELENLCCEYPLYTIGGIFGKTIDRMFENKSKLLKSTGRVHDIKGKKYNEYEIFGIKFIKFTNEFNECLLSDGTKSKKGENAYLKVEKIPFTVDLDAEVIYSDIIIMAHEFDHIGREFDRSDLKQYLNNDFLKSINDELERNKELSFQESQLGSSGDNRYKFDYSPLTEEEIIEICLNSNIAVFLHGKTGTGKTERMVSLDRNLELVDFGCTSSDGFTGIVAKDFNSKELFLYEPYWYKSLCKKCEEQPQLLHILFLEELTNAKSDIQKVAFEVTLNKTLTNSGFRLKLPENAVVCAAGNEASESMSANELSEPLFGRFAHVYIDTNSDDWVKWATKRKKENRVLIYKQQEEPEMIHPAIVDYIRINGDKVLRTAYNGEKPNADPRKWAMASKALYQCNNPNVLRAFVGEELTKHFIEFSKLKLITVDDVINDRVDMSNLPTDSTTKWYMVLILSSVSDEHFDKVREFVASFGKELVALFDYEWSKDNEERIMRLYNEHPIYTKRLGSNGN